MNPSLPLNDEQLAFIKELDKRTMGSLITCYDAWASQIENAGGCRLIYRNENGTPILYLKRYYLYRGPEREAMIHQFFLGDKGPLHDHPADSWGRILSVGYRERLCTSIINGRTEGEYEVERVAGDWSFRPGSNPNHDDFRGFHKVKLRNPKFDAGMVCTLFIMEKRNPNSWGFRDNDGNFVPYKDMAKNENTDQLQSEADQYGMGWFPVRVA